jgi:hypothetical protein
MVPKPLKSLKVSVHQGRHQSPRLLEASNSDVANDDDKVNPEDR